MKTVWCVSLLLLLLGAFARSVECAQTQNVVQFGVMMSCVLDTSVIRSGLDYIGYGCYCGFGGDGTPLDDTDRCCETHDHCYTRVQTSDMCRGYNQAYIIPYKYQLNDCGSSEADIKCMDESAYSSDYAYTQCAVEMCKCDMAGAKCFRSARSTYNPDLRRYKQSDCV
ncbi:phospholipase A2 AP-PLA2-I-like [Diadema antillarum]|uniref:phospholipase A2 AP-PLA2-I-like n=2 Tax=Diadema antillarum TaxID=105358 RepID=UPI003A87D13E